MRQIIFDTREKEKKDGGITFEMLPKWEKKHHQLAKIVNIDKSCMVTGDCTAGMDNYIPVGEIKWGGDCHNYVQLKSELWRMAMHHQQHPRTFVFAIFIDTPQYKIDKKELKILVGFCQKYAVTFYHCNSKMEGIEKIMSLLMRTERPEIREPPRPKLKGLSDLAQLFAVIDGVSAQLAQSIACFYEESFKAFYTSENVKQELLYITSDLYNRNMKALVEKILRRFGL